MKLSNLFLIAALAIIPTGYSLGQEEIKPAELKLDRPVDFRKDIQPILKANCLACHNKSDRQSGLSLESVEEMIKGGDIDTGIVKGKPEESYLYQLASHQQEPTMPEMPNDVGAKPLTPKQLALLRQWIIEGAQPGREAEEIKPINWRPPHPGVTPSYAMALSPNSENLAVSRANRIDVYSAGRWDQPITLSDPKLVGFKTESGEFGPESAHLDFVNALAFSPDGQVLASGGYRTVKLWQLQNERQITDVNLDAVVKQVAVDHASGRFAVVDGQHKITLFDAEGAAAGQELQLEAAIEYVSLLPGQPWLVTTSGTRASVWSLESSAGTGGWDIPENITCIAATTDRRVITGHADHVIRLWKLSEDFTTATLERELKGHNKPVKCLAVLTNSTHQIVSGGDDGVLRWWDLNNGGQIKSFNHGASLSSVSVHDNEQYFASASTDQRVVVFDKNGKQLHEIRTGITQQRERFDAQQLVTVGKALTTAGDAKVKAAEKRKTDREESLKKAGEAIEKAKQDLEAKVKATKAAQDAFDKAAKELEEKPDDQGRQKNKTTAEDKLNKAREEEATAQKALESAERGQKLEQEAVEQAKQNLTASQAALKTAREELKSAEEQLKQSQTAEQQARSIVRRIAFLPGTDELLLIGENGDIELWDGVTGQPLRNSHPEGEFVAVLERDHLLFKGGEKSLVVRGIDPRWVLMARLGAAGPSPEELASSLFTNRVLALDFSPNGELLATGGGETSRSGELYLWSMDNLSVRRAIPDAHSDTITSLKFSRDGSHLLTGSTDKFAKVFDVSSGDLVRSFEGHTEHVLGVGWQADGLRIATAGADKAIKIWNAETGEQTRTITNYSKQVTDLDFNGTDPNILTCSGDRNVKFHDVNNGRNFRSFGGAADYLYQIAISHDGQTVFAVGQSGQVHVWNASDGRAIRQLKPTSAN